MPKACPSDFGKFEMVTISTNGSASDDYMWPNGIASSFYLPITFVTDHDCALLSTNRNLQNDIELGLQP